MKTFLFGLLLAAFGLTSTAARAVDGCKVLLCLAGNWKKIAPCQGPVKEAMWDMARGRSYPHCDTNQGGQPTTPGQQTPTRAQNTGIDENSCPVMYSRYSQESGMWVGCKYSGVISIVVDAQPWTEVFWDGSGDTSTRYSAAARAQLGNMVDPTYDNDLAACGACRPPPLKGPER